MNKKTASAMMLTLLLTSLLTLAFNIKLIEAESGILYVNDNISRSSIEWRSTPTMKSFLKNGLDTRLMDDFQLPFEVRGKWRFGNELKWGDFAFVDDDSAELVIGLDDMRPNSYSEMVDLIVSNGGEVVNTVSMNGKVAAVVVDVPHGDMSTFVVEVENGGLSRYIEPNMRFEVDFVPNDPQWPEQWGPRKIEAEWAWNTTMGDSSVLVAVIDTGVDYDHPDLATNYVALGYDWVNNDTYPMDDDGHGTHCAGIIGAVINNGVGIAGLAQVRIMAEKGLDRYGSGSADDLANAIVHAVDQGADILSLSWGGYGESALIYEAVEYADDHGVLVIAAAGNEATECKFYPAAYEEVVAVTATNETDNPAWFTNFGDWIEVAAPGVDIYSTLWDDTYEYASGTSMSTPHVAGVAALIWSQFPNMTRDRVRAQLRCTADDLGNSGFDEYYGYGRINARRAVEQALPEHDVILLYWKLPCVLKPLDTVAINCTLLNFGVNNESDITVQLLVNDSVADSKFIEHLVSGASTIISLDWSPVVEGKYNVTLYVVPVQGEISTENNILFRCAIVRLLEVIVIPDDFSTIQKAINEVCPGYTIRVESGIYYEHIVIDKSVTLIGEHRQATVIDGYGIEIVVCVYASSANITRFTIQNGDGGIFLFDSHNNIIDGNTVTDCFDGIFLSGCSNNIIRDNEVTNNTRWGMYLEFSADNTLFDNEVTETHTGILLAASKYNKIANNTMANNGIGNYYYYSRNNAIIANLITENVLGIHLELSGNNAIYHNDIINNEKQVRNQDSTNTWDDGYPSGGNYWSDYAGVDVFSGPNQNETGRDEIGDTSYIIDMNNRDRYPLWYPWTLPPAEHELAVFLEAPTIIPPGYSSLLIATVVNKGLNNETSVELLLIIDGNIVNSTIIPFLQVGSSYTINHQWPSTIEGIYNITAYAPPVLGEEFTTNNIVIKTVSVFAGTCIYVNPLESTVVLGETFTVNINVAAVEDLWSWQVMLYFDPAVLNCTDVWTPLDHVFADKPYIPGTSIDNTDGYVMVFACLLGDIPGFTGSGILCQIEFKTIGLGTSDLTFSRPYGEDTYLFTYEGFPDVTIPVTLIDGVVEVIPPQPPVANFTWTPSIAKVGESVTFNASASTPNGGTIIKYEWNFGDGGTTTGKIVTHIYANPGNYTVTLNITDSEGFWDVEQKQIQVVQPHGPKAEFTATPETASIGENIKFNASASQPGWNGTQTMPITEYHWDFGDGNKTTTSTPIVYHSFQSAGVYYITLTVYAPKAIPDTDSVTHKVTVFSIPVGGYSFPIQVPAKTEPVLPYIALIATLTAIFTKMRPKTKRKR